MKLLYSFVETFTTMKFQLKRTVMIYKQHYLVVICINYDTYVIVLVFDNLRMSHFKIDI